MPTIRIVTHPQNGSHMIGLEGYYPDGFLDAKYRLPHRIGRVTNPDQALQLVNPQEVIDLVSQLKQIEFWQDAEVVGMAALVIKVAMSKPPEPKPEEVKILEFTDQ